MRAAMTGCRCRPASVKRAIRASSDGTFSGSFALSCERSSSRPVTSTSSHAVTSGTTVRERTIWSAITRRTPVSGVREATVSPERVSVPPTSAVAAGAAEPAEAATGDGAAAAPDAAGAAGAPTPPSAAASTSARVIRPSGPVPVRAATSTPRSRASLRTIGELTRGARTVPTAGAEAAGAVAAVRRPRLDGRVRPLAPWPEVP